jgi:hypothetical protein
VSVNYQYVVGDVDWSPDGTRLAYIMATLPSLRGLELFVSDVVGSRASRRSRRAPGKKENILREVQAVAHNRARCQSLRRSDTRIDTTMYSAIPAASTNPVVASRGR